MLGEEMRLDARQPERQPVLAEGGDRLGVGQQGRAGALVDAPGARRRHVDARVGVDQAAVIGGEQIAALGFRQKPGKGAPRLGKHGAHAIEKPVDLALRGRERCRAGSARRHARDGSRHRAAPGSSPTSRRTPAIARCRARGAAARYRRRDGRACCRAISPSGVERPPPRWSKMTMRQIGGIEEPAMHRGRAGARPAMQEQDAGPCADCPTPPNTSCGAHRAASWPVR